MSLITIKSMEKNSGLGVGVFSKSGKKENYKYLALSPKASERYKEFFKISQAAINQKFLEALQDFDPEVIESRRHELMNAFHKKIEDKIKQQKLEEFYLNPVNVHLVRAKSSEQLYAEAKPVNPLFSKPKNSLAQKLYKIPESSIFKKKGVGKGQKKLGVISPIEYARPVRASVVRPDLPTSSFMATSKEHHRNKEVSLN